MTYHHHDIHYYLGGWNPPYGIEFKADLLSAVFTTLISVVTVISMPFAFSTVQSEIPKNKISTFYTCFLLCFTGTLGITISNDIFNIYVFLELFAISAYSLLSMGCKHSANAAFEYLIIGTIASTFYLLGIGLLYMMTGTLNISDMQSKLLALSDNRVVILGAILIFTGLIIKSALFPLHRWLIDAYTYSPSYITVFCSGVATKVSTYLIIRFIYSVFNTNIPIHNILYPLSLCAIISGSLLALRQTNIRKALSYSSISQIGYIMLAISLNSSIALTTAILHIIFHSLTKPGLFCLTQLNKQNPLTMIMLGILSASLIGIPLTGAFVSKWYLVTSTAALGNYFTVAIITLGSLLTFFYTWGIIENIKWSPATSQSHSMIISPIVFTALIVALGFYSTPLYQIINLAVLSLE